MIDLALAAANHSVPLTVWICATLAIGLIWLRRHLALNRACQDDRLTEQQANVSLEAWPHVSVLVAAKDEEPNIARCLQGLLAQDYPTFEVIAVNDRSADRTGQIMDEHAARDPRLVALHVKELEPGWFGKTNAMRVGVERATGTLLCFTDADCTFESPRLLRAAVSYAHQNRVAFLSVLPRLEAHGLWEKVVQPVAGAIMVFWFPPQKVNDPASPCAYANGAFMLISRQAYESLGGHASAKAALNEDMQLARQAKRLGVRLRVLPGGTLFRVRMYTGLRQIWRGWSRIFYGCFGTFGRLLGSVLMLSVFSLSPYLTLLAAPLAGSAAPWVAAAAAVAIACQQSVLVRFYRLSGSAPGLAITYPIGAALCLGMMISGMSRLWGVKTTWRGTRYRGGAGSRGVTIPGHPGLG